MKMIGTWCAALLAGFLAVGTAAETVEIRDNSGNIVGRADLDGYYSSDELNRKLDEARKDMQLLLEEQRRKAADETARQVRQAIENERANQARMRLEIEREIERLKTSYSPIGTITFYYDVAGYLTGSAAETDGAVVRRNAAGTVIGTELIEGGKTLYYDGSGNLTGARVVSGGTALVYNAAGEVYSREVTTGELTTYYNAAGRVTGTSRKAGNSTVFRNTAGYMTGTITEAPGRTTWYDDMGIVTGTARTEALCRKFYEGKLVAVDNPAELHERRKQEAAMNVQTAQARRNEAGRKTVRHYDVNGRLIATTESGGGTIRRYGATGEHMGTTAAGSR